MLGHTYKITDLGNKSYSMEAHCGHIHYKDSGLFVPVNYVLKDGGKFWEMEKASYRLYVNKDFSKPRLIYFQNRFEGANHVITYEPFALAWIHKTDREDIRVFKTQQAVIGTLTKDTILWENAFGAGLDFEVVVQRSGVRKQLVIKNKAAIGLPPSNDYVLAILFKYDGAGLSILDDTGSEWNQNDFKLMIADKKFTIGENALQKSFIQPSYAFSGMDYRESIRVAWKRHNGNVFQIKIVPLATLNKATYPLTIDTVTSFYAGAGDGMVQNRNADWATAHNNSSGTAANYTDTTQWVVCQHYDGQYDIYRMFFPIDTSVLTAAAVITVASFIWYGYGFGDGDNDGNDFIRLIASTFQDSMTELTTDDFNDCGILNQPGAGFADLDLTGLSEGTFTRSLNAHGIGYISKTGWTTFGFREGHDCNDDPPGNTLRNYMRVVLSEYAYADIYDPYLSITYHLRGPHNYYRTQLAL
jgi:hypothetical protein